MKGIKGSLLPCTTVKVRDDLIEKYHKIYPNKLRGRNGNWHHTSNNEYIEMSIDEVLEYREKKAEIDKLQRELKEKGINIQK